jgi:hypothetical protein
MLKKRILFSRILHLCLVLPFFREAIEFKVVVVPILAEQKLLIRRRKNSDFTRRQFFLLSGAWFLVQVLL